MNARLVTAVVAGLTVFAPAYSQDFNMSSRPEFGRYGSVSYVTGGIGEEEVAQMKVEAPYHPLALQFLEDCRGHSDYSAYEWVDIRDAVGNTVLAAQAKGPFMLVDLPRGRYTVTASNGGWTQSRQVAVGGGRQQVSFTWPLAEYDAANLPCMAPEYEYQAY